MTSARHKPGTAVKLLDALQGRISKVVKALKTCRDDLRIERQHTARLQRSDNLIVDMCMTAMGTTDGRPLSGEEAVISLIAHQGRKFASIQAAVQEAIENED